MPAMNDALAGQCKISRQHWCAGKLFPTIKHGRVQTRLGLEIREEPLTHKLGKQRFPKMYNKFIVRPSLIAIQNHAHKPFGNRNSFSENVIFYISVGFA
jgi:hypothetical protein